MATKARKRAPQSLQAWMERHGVSQQRLAKLAGMPQSTISQILSGSRRCSLEKALDLHDLTGVPVEKLAQWPRTPVTRRIAALSQDETGVSRA
jgi:transcriptional regulator with XRE-family HTH domain